MNLSSSKLPLLRLLTSAATGWGGAWLLTLAVLLLTVSAGFSQTQLTLVATNFFGGAGDQRGTAIAIANGSLYLTGNASPESGGAGDSAFVVRFDLPLSATPVWSRTFGSGSTLRGLAATASGIYGAGQSYSLTTDSAGGKEGKPVLANFPLNGTNAAGPEGTTWVAGSGGTSTRGAFFSYGGTEAFFATAAGGGVIYAAGFGQPASQAAYLLAKFDPSGNRLAAVTDSTVGVQLGVQSVPSGGGSDAQALAVDEVSVYLAGETAWTSEGDQPTGRPAIWRYSTNLTLTARWRDATLTGILRAVTTAGGAVYAAGNTYVPSTANSENFLVQKWDTAGNRLWSTNWGGAGTDMLLGIVSVNGRLFAAGHTASQGAGGKDAVLFELNPVTGAILSTNLWGGAQDDVANGLATDGTDLYLVGETKSFAVNGNTVGQNEAFVLRYAVPARGTVVAWGSNSEGQTNVPAGLSGVVAVAAGDSSLALKSDGTVVAWGPNNRGQATVPAGLSGVVAVSAGGYHNLAVKSDGTVSAWGWNDKGQLNVPAGLAGVVAVAAGGEHCLALKSDGTVVAWGYNGNGETSVPAGLSGVVAVAAGANHNLALKSDGTVVAWGYNGNGQTTVPAGLSGVVAVAGGHSHSLALKSDGTVVAWGDSSYGATTVPVAAQSGVVAVSAGAWHGMALKSDGTVLAWGATAGGNDLGQTIVPAGLSGVTAISAGGYHSLALVGTAATPRLTSIAVTPASPSVSIGANQQFTATGTYSDGSTRTLTSGGNFWTSAAAIPSASYGLGGAFVGGKFYAISGFATTRVAVYDTAGTNNTWSTAAALPALLQYFGTAVLDGKIYVVGGDTGGSGQRATLYRYDPAQNIWTTLAAMPLGARFHCDAVALNGKIHVLGGTDGSAALDRVEIYDPASNTWTNGTPLPAPRYVTMSGAINGKIYVAGGQDAGGASVTNGYVFDPALNAWSVIAPMAAQQAGIATVLNGKLYVIGGSAPDNRVQSYDPVANLWSTNHAVLPTGRRQMAVAADEVSGRIFAASGYNNTYASDLEIFTPAGDVTWASGTNAVASINANGLATAVAGGTATITATAGSITSSAATLTVTVPAGNAQLRFATANGGLTNPIFDTDGVTKLPGDSGFVAQIYAGTTSAEGSLSAYAPSLAFGTGAGAGFVSGPTNTQSGFPGFGGQTLFVQIRVWNTANGSTYETANAVVGARVGKSSIFAVTAGGTPSGGGAAVAAPAVSGFASFSLSGQLGQFITFGSLPNRTFGDAPFAVAPVASSGLPVTLSVVSGPVSLAGNTVTLLGAGSVTLRATQAGDATNSAAAPVDQSFTVAPANQAITFAALPDRQLSVGSFNLSATAGSGLAVGFSVVSGPASLSGNTLTLTSGGLVTVRAAQTGNANYNAAPTVDQSFTVLISTPPLVSLATPLHRQSFRSGFGVALSANASDPGGFVTNVEFYANNLLVGSNNVAPYNFSWTPPGAALYTLRAEALDNAGGRGISTNIEVRVQDLAPFVALNAPAGGSTFALPTNITLTASAFDLDGFDNLVARVEFLDFGTNVIGTVTNPLSVTVSFIWTNPPAGQHSLSARAVDAVNFALVSAEALVTVNYPAGAVPVFSFAQATYSVAESAGNAVLTVLKNQSPGGSVNFTTVDGTARAAAGNTPGDYTPTNGVLVFAANDTQKTIAIPILNDASFEGDQSFTVRLSAPDASVIVTNPAVATVIIRDDDQPPTTNSVTTVFPPAAQLAANALGALQVSVLTMNLPNIGTTNVGQWRLLWDTVWHNHYDVIEKLQPGSYEVVFQPRDGFVTPTNLVAMVNPGTSLSVTGLYSATNTLQTGSLRVDLTPAAAQWRLQGEPGWRASGVPVAGLVAGPYVVEFNDQTDYLRPSPKDARVFANFSSTVAFTYPPGSTAWELATVNPSRLGTDAPYAYTGQLLSESGYGTGTAVKRRVVLTAGHLVFNDRTLTFATNLYWFHRRYAAQYEPRPQQPRGSYYFAGYDAQRTLENTPGVSTPASQHLDAAALFFYEDAAAGGQSGYLVSDAMKSWLADSEEKLLTGYPLSAPAPLDRQRKLQVADLARLALDPLPGAAGVFTTAAFRSAGGNSGGPLSVKFSEKYYPAGIFLGGTAQSVVRAIDADVVDLINRADLTANTGDNATDAGEGNSTAPGPLPVGLGSGSLTVTLGGLPAGAGWRLVPSGTGVAGAFITDANYVSNRFVVLPNLLEFAPVAGYLTPGRVSAPVLRDTTRTVSVVYARATNFLNFAPAAPGPEGFRIEVSASSFGRYVVYGRVDLGTGAWVPLVTNTLDAQGRHTFTNPPGTPYRFFRTGYLTEP